MVQQVRPESQPVLDERSQEQDWFQAWDETTTHIIQQVADYDLAHEDWEDLPDSQISASADRIQTLQQPALTHLPGLGHIISLEAEKELRENWARLQEIAGEYGLGQDMPTADELLATHQEQHQGRAVPTIGSFLDAQDQIAFERKMEQLQGLITQDAQKEGTQVDTTVAPVGTEEGSAKPLTVNDKAIAVGESLLEKAGESTVVKGRLTFEKGEDGSFTMRETESGKELLTQDSEGHIEGSVPDEFKEPIADRFKAMQQERKSEEAEL